VVNAATGLLFPTHVDVVVVGAGLSGIGAGYRLQTEHPEKTYLILEARESIGGTWDLFRYPGIRSDSDMFTLGYPFKPWLAPKAIADGRTILGYIRETAAEFGIDRRVRLGARVVAANWSTPEARWTLTVEVRRPEGTAQRTLTCGFLYSCAGYYRYDQAYSPVFPGTDSFAGRLVHPQFWPEDLDCSGRRVVVIGSGATAVTLVPALAASAAHVTMLQRSPSWIGAVPRRDPVADALRAILPPWAAHRAIRSKNIAFGIAFYQFCTRAPRAARRLLTSAVGRQLDDRSAVREHFTPTYNPWEQRFCAAPDGDLFRAMKQGRASVVTDQVDRFVPEGIRLASGRTLPAEVVVTATGLQLLAFGGITPLVDGRPVDLARQFAWRGAMVSSLPNFAVCVGYTNASWMLRADLTSRLVCKVLRFMDAHNLAAVVPRPPPGLRERPLLGLTSGYIRRSIAEFPKQGHRGPWRVHQNYLVDSVLTLRGRLGKTLDGMPRSAVRVATPDVEVEGSAAAN
jgi:cation diffusion facilitator CzcD-associated flavoprotein CzcO